MSFWANNAFAPTWGQTLSQLWNNDPPKLCNTLKLLRPVKAPPGCTVIHAREEHIPLILEFWGRYFSISSVCKSAVSPAYLTGRMRTKTWQIVIALNSQGELIGTVIRRHIRNLHVQSAKWAEAGIIDYFCVHPAWRSRGVGRTLLDTIHNNSTFPLAPQLIFWEGWRISLPPLSIGCFLKRRCIPSSGIQANQIPPSKELWAACVKGCEVWTEDPGEEITFWKIKEKWCVVWNTMHTAVPDGGLIGVVLGGDPDALAEASGHTWRVLLLPRTTLSSSYMPPGWSFDSVFQWIAYNLSVGTLGGPFPCIGV